MATDNQLDTLKKQVKQLLHEKQELKDRVNKMQKEIDQLRQQLKKS